MGVRRKAMDYQPIVFIPTGIRWRRTSPYGNATITGTGKKPLSNEDGGVLTVLRGCVWKANGNAAVISCVAHCAIKYSQFDLDFCGVGRNGDQRIETEIFGNF